MQADADVGELPVGEIVRLEMGLIDEAFNADEERPPYDEPPFATYEDIAPLAYEGED